jgi:hypothetical protein
MPQISLNTGIADHEMGLQSQKRNCQDEVADERRISLAYLGEKEIYYKAQKNIVLILYMRPSSYSRQHSDVQRNTSTALC